ncbi:TetR/AcrR family transcriptional regulator [Streptomyces sp. NA04227]|uniref:TetR/AcrR family transcriptional regulator n=1 Tax=Streptomyces sp. NA04227 TaxID=2742136 RepID=UPI0015901154|nr:TetR/AcrR family transcriptional regulator [Streptomyces sp. NA04227]QKW11050.1 TetR/AcrR family transcriptional regulator [Streptomyces sp. NA04227]
MPRAVREKQMLDAAVRVFARHGYQAASMDEIAKLAGVSKPLVYLYLNSKEDLFAACIRRESQALVEAIRVGVDTTQPADRQLWDGLRSFFVHTAENPDSWAVVHTQATAQGEPFAGVAAAARQSIITFVTALIHAAHAERESAVGENAVREGCDGGGKGEGGGEAAGSVAPGAETTRREYAALAHALIGAAESLADWSLTQSTIPAHEAAATMMNFAWAGLGGLLEGKPWTASPQLPPGATPVT